MSLLPSICSFFFFNDTATTEIYTLSLHDALPLASLLAVKPSVKVIKSYMVVAYPALTSLSFARMSPKVSFHFNHLYMTGRGAGGQIEYSMLGDSGFGAQGAATTEFLGGTDALIDSAKDYFWMDVLQSRHLFAYECLMTEF